VRPFGLGEPLERTRGHEGLRQPVVLLGRSVAPVDVIGLRETRYLVYPRPQARVVRGGLVRGCGVCHGCFKRSLDAFGALRKPTRASVGLIVCRKLCLGNYAASSAYSTFDSAPWIGSPGLLRGT